MTNATTTTMNEININMKSKHIAKVRIMRDGFGMKIYYKSKMFHELFSQYSSNMHRYSNWGENMVKGYDTTAFISDALFLSTSTPDRFNVEAEYARKNMKYAIRGWGSDNLLINPNFMTKIAIPNIAWLCCRGADEGVIISLNRPMSNRAFEMYVKQVGKFMKFIYEQFLKPDNREITLSVTYKPLKGSRIKGTLVKPMIIDDPILEELV